MSTSAGIGPPAAQEREYLSTALRRVNRYFVLCGGAEIPLLDRSPVLLLLHGLGGSAADWMTHTRIAKHVQGISLMVVMPDGASGWYTNAVSGGERREDDILGDLLPHVRANYSVSDSRADWTIAGISMGGYGAVKLALKHPEVFGAAFSHSGALEAPRSVPPHPVFGDSEIDSAMRRSEDVYWLAEQAMCGLPSDRPRLELDCGSSDDLVGQSARFADHLTFLGYPHSYTEMPGYHTWPYWDRAIRLAVARIGRSDRR
jgi:S-formylglutathione hydrolase FrmB